MLSQTSSWKNHHKCGAQHLGFRTLRLSSVVTATTLTEVGNTEKDKVALHVHRSRQQTGQGLGDLVAEWSAVYA